MATTNQEPIVILGAGGHAKVVIDAVEKQGVYKVVSLLDDNPNLLNREVYGYRVINDLVEAGKQGCTSYVIAIGDNKVRQKVREKMRETSFGLTQPIIHPSAQLARGVKIGDGTILMAGTIVNSDSTIADNVIVNTNVTIDHDCNIEHGVHIAPSSTLCGGVSIGSGTLIGAGSTIHPGVKVGPNVIVGAGSTVLADVPDNVTVFGTPAEIKG